jgi:hypothetical protein
VDVKPKKLGILGIYKVRNISGNVNCLDPFLQSYV